MTSWRQWYDPLPWNEKLRYKSFHKIDKIQDKLLDYEWMPDWVFSEGFQRPFCVILRAHTWERSVYHPNVEGCVYCRKSRKMKSCTT